MCFAASQVISIILAGDQDWHKGWALVAEEPSGMTA